MTESNVAAQERAVTTDAPAIKTDSKNRSGNKSGSGTEANSDSVNIEAILAPSELINQHEDADWGEVPGTSTAEAGAWTAQLIVALDRAQVGL